MNDIKNKEASKAHKIELEREAARETAARLENITVSMKVKSGGAGRMYGSVTAKDIAEALEAQHKIKIDRRKMVMAEPVKQYGTYHIDVKLFTDVTGKITLQVTEA